MPLEELPLFVVLCELSLPPLHIVVDERWWLGDGVHGLLVLLLFFAFLVSGLPGGAHWVLPSGADPESVDEWQIYELVFGFPVDDRNDGLICNVHKMGDNR